MSPQFAADVSLLLSATADPVVHRSSGCQQTGPRYACVLHSLFIFTLSMRLRGNSWFLLRGPRRAIVPDQMGLGQEVM